MLSLDDLSQAINAYASGDVSLDEFLDWFSDASRNRLAFPLPVRDACLEVDEALARLYADEISETQFQKELVAASPFVLGPVYTPADIGG